MSFAKHPLGHPQPGLLLMIIEPKPKKVGNGQKQAEAGCRVERGLSGAHS